MGTSSQAPEHLFHGTGIYALAAIIQSNSLWEGIHWGKPGEPRGPRLTRSYEVAKEFIRYNVHWGEGGVLVFNRAALSADFKIKSYIDTFYAGGLLGEKEEEEAIIAKVVTDLDRYLVCVHCDPEVIELAGRAENMEAAQNEGGWAFDGEDPQLALDALQALAGCPKLNLWTPATGFPRLGNDFGQGAHKAHAHRHQCLQVA